MAKIVFWTQEKPGTSILANSVARHHPKRGDIQSICPSNAKLGRKQDKRRWLEDGNTSARWHGMTAVLDIIDLDVSKITQFRQHKLLNGSLDAHRLWTLNIDSLPANVQTDITNNGYASVTFAQITGLITRKDTNAAFSPTITQTTTTGAGLFTTPTELKSLDLSVAPYAAAWTDLQGRLNPNIALQSVVDAGPNDCGGSPPNQFCTTDRITRYDYVAAQAQCYAARDLAIAYQLNANESHATKAIQIIENWTLGANRMAPSLTTVVGAIEQYITIPALFHAADLLRDHSGWTNFAGVVQWAKDFGQSCYAYRSTQSNDNKLDWLIYCTAAAQSFQRDDVALGTTLDYFLSRQVDRILTDGRMAADYQRVTGLSYSTYAMLAQCGTAEIAWRAGRDLFSGDLERALDYHVPYVLDPNTWPYSQTEPFANANVECYEMANKRKPKTTYASVITNAGQPIWGSRTVGPSTLMFG